VSDSNSVTVFMLVVVVVVVVRREERRRRWALVVFVTQHSSGPYCSCRSQTVSFVKWNKRQHECVYGALG